MDFRLSFLVIFWALLSHWAPHTMLIILLAIWFLVIGTEDLRYRLEWNKVFINTLLKWRRIDKMCLLGAAEAQKVTTQDLGKRRSNLEIWQMPCMSPKLGEFFQYGLENSVFAIYSNICFSLITFNLKVRIRSRLF